MKNNDELDTIMAINNGITERYLNILKNGIMNDDLNEFYKYFAEDIKCNSHQGKDEVIKALDNFVDEIKDKDMICINVISNLKVIEALDYDLETIIFIPEVHEFDRDKIYNIEYKNKKLLLIADNNEKLKRDAFALEFNTSGNISEIKIIRIDDKCEYKVLD